MENDPIIKHCEYCGEIVRKPYWSLLLSMEYAICLQSDMIINIDKKEKIVYLNDGTHYDYLFQLDEYLLVHPFLAKIHLSCSEKCEDNFFLIKKYSSIYSTDVLKGKKGPLIRFKGNKSTPDTFKPVALKLKDFTTITKKCEICIQEYPDFENIPHFERKWFSQKIIEKHKEFVENNNKPTFSTEKYSYILSGISDKSPSGDFYAYKASKERNFHNFCSNDCAFIYSVKEESLVTIVSVLDKDRIGIISPEAEQFNDNLQNASPHRPSFIGYF